jgi:hypothetical protein
MSASKFRYCETEDEELVSLQCNEDEAFQTDAPNVGSCYSTFQNYTWNGRVLQDRPKRRGRIMLKLVCKKSIRVTASVV